MLFRACYTFRMKASLVTPYLVFGGPILHPYEQIPGWVFRAVIIFAVFLIVFLTVLAVSATARACLEQN